MYEFFKLVKGDVRYFLRLVGLVILFQDMVEYEVAHLFLGRTHLMYSLYVYFLGMLLGDIVVQIRIAHKSDNICLVSSILISKILISCSIFIFFANMIKLSEIFSVSFYAYANHPLSKNNDFYYSVNVCRCLSICFVIKAKLASGRFVKKRFFHNIIISK